MKASGRTSPGGRPCAALFISLTAISFLGSGVLPVAAAAAIVPGRGIAGVRIGESEARVRATLGRPRKVVPPTWAYGKPLDGLVGFGHGGRVNYVSTISRAQKTNRRIGPGSSIQDLKAAYPKARCHTRARERRALCALTTHDRHRVMKTDFLFDGRLQKVDMYSVRAPRKTGPK